MVIFRKFVLETDRLEDLVRLGTLTRPVARFLQCEVAGGMNIIRHRRNAGRVKKVRRLGVTTPDGTSHLWKARASYAANEHILAWWGVPQDEVLGRLIDEFAWLYPWHIVEAIVAVTPEDVVAAWREKDPLCEQYAWYNVLLYFGVARARTTGLEQAMRPPETLNCLRCNKAFRQDQVGASTARRFGDISNIRYCQYCSGAAFAGGSDLDDLKLSDADIADWIRAVATLTGLIPAQDFFSGGDFLETVSGDSARAQLLDLAARRPTAKRIKDSFESWLNLLTVSGVLPDERTTPSAASDQLPPTAMYACLCPSARSMTGSRRTASTMRRSRDTRTATTEATSSWVALSLSSSGSSATPTTTRESRRNVYAPRSTAST